MSVGVRRCDFAGGGLHPPAKSDRPGIPRLAGPVLLCGLALAAACDRRAEARADLLLAAAADLAPVLPELTAAFETETGIRVTATIGASGALAQQVLHGAPVDVFASADRARIDEVARAGRVVAGTTAVYAYGRLALHAAAGARLASFDDLAGPDVRRIAIANPESAPYGLAAKTALQRAGLWDSLQPRIVIAENVRQTVQYVESGGADVALTSLSLVRSEGGRHITVPDSLYEPLEQVLAVIAGRPYESEARALAHFFTHGAGREILRRHGFELPDTLPGPRSEDPAVPERMDGPR